MPERDEIQIDRWGAIRSRVGSGLRGMRAPGRSQAQLAWELGDLGRGLNTVNDFVASLGMTSTLVDHPPAYPGESLYGYPTENRITALDSNRGLRAIWDGPSSTKVGATTCCRR